MISTGHMVYCINMVLSGSHVINRSHDRWYQVGHMVSAGYISSFRCGVCIRFDCNNKSAGESSGEFLPLYRTEPDIAFHSKLFSC